MESQVTRVQPESGGIDPGMPERIGEYRIIGKLGQGGMGVVYEAEQDTPRRRVALKLVRGSFPDASQDKMFKLEMQALARLNHPGIAAIYDAGVSEQGWPYFSMELAQGRNLDFFLRSECGRRMSLEERLHLFLQICDAVTHAHQRGVIHRDLKPGNILVAEESERQTSVREAASGIGRLPEDSGSRGEHESRCPSSKALTKAWGDDSEARSRNRKLVKVLDFGLARMTEREVYATSFISETGRLIGTLQYMSPEQARGDAGAIDVRTDVYALSLMLFEIVTGALPYALDPGRLPDSLRIICESNPTDPRSLNRSTPPDVATIILKGLEKQPERRYASAAEMAADVRRFLAFEPILARPASKWYLFRRFARRNRMAVASACVVLASIVMGLVITGAALSRAMDAERVARDRADEAETARVSERVQREKAERERSRAEEERETAAAVNAFLNEMLASVDPATGNRQMTVQEALDRAAENIDRDAFPGRPRVEAAVRDTLGRSYMALGRYEQADRHFTAALRLFESMGGPDDAGTLDALNNLASLRQRQARFEEAGELFRRALERLTRVAGEEHSATLATINNLGMLLAMDGKYAEAEPLLRKALEGHRRVSGPEHIATLDALSNLSTVLQYQGKLKAAEELAQESLEIRRRVFGNRHPGTLVAVNNLGTVLAALDRTLEAEPYYREGLEMSREILGEDHPETLISMNNLAGLLHDLRRDEESEKLYRETIAAMTRVLGERHPDTIAAQRDLASALRDMKRYDDAEALLRRALAKSRTVLGEDHPDTLTAEYGLGTVLMALGREEEAEPLLRDAMERFARTVNRDSWKYGMYRASWAESLARIGRVGEAVGPMEEGVGILVTSLGAAAETTRNAIRPLVELLETLGRREEAAAWRGKLKEGGG